MVIQSDISEVDTKADYEAYLETALADIERMKEEWDLSTGLALSDFDIEYLHEQVDDISLDHQFSILNWTNSDFRESARWEETVYEKIHDVHPSQLLTEAVTGAIILHLHNRLDL